jgi:flagellar basal body-associated protein FliL
MPNQYVNLLITLVMFVALVAFVAAIVYATKTSFNATSTRAVPNPTIDLDIESARTPVITVNGMPKPNY